jgi:hypothetical protein
LLRESERNRSCPVAPEVRPVSSPNTYPGVSPSRVAPENPYSTQASAQVVVPGPGGSCAIGLRAVYVGALANHGLWSA